MADEALSKPTIIGIILGVGVAVILVICIFLLYVRLRRCEGRVTVPSPIWPSTEVKTLGDNESV